MLDLSCENSEDSVTLVLYLRQSLAHFEVAQEMFVGQTPHEPRMAPLNRVRPADTASQRQLNRPASPTFPRLSDVGVPLDIFKEELDCKPTFL